MLTLSTPAIALPSGAQALVRLVRASDAASMMELLQEVARDGRGVVRTLPELSQSVAEMETDIEKWVSGTRSGARGAWIVVVIGERVVAEVSIRRMAPQRVRHIGHIGLSVHPKFQRLGLGRALMRAAEEWATRGPGMEMGGISRLDLCVLADNARAITLYESLGYVREGCRRDFIKREDGSFVDDLMFAKLLPPTTPPTSTPPTSARRS